MKNIKEISVLDVIAESLDELDTKVDAIFQKDSEAWMQCQTDLLSLVIGRMIMTGWNKKELIEFTTEIAGDAANDLIEFEMEDSSHNVISIAKKSYNQNKSKNKM
jgi:hypothetical protein